VSGNLHWQDNKDALEKRVGQILLFTYAILNHMKLLILQIKSGQTSVI
jgi:hypothetical protein